MPEVHQRMPLYKRVSQVRDGGRGRRAARRRSATATGRLPAGGGRACSPTPRCASAARPWASAGGPRRAAAPPPLRPEHPARRPRPLARIPARAAAGPRLTPAGRPARARSWRRRGPLAAAGRDPRRPGGAGRRRHRNRRDRVKCPVGLFDNGLRQRPGSRSPSCWPLPACRGDRGVPDPVILDLGEQVGAPERVRAPPGRASRPRQDRRWPRRCGAALLEPFLEERVLVLEARSRGLVSEGRAAAEEQAAVEQLLADEVLARVEVSRGGGRAALPGAPQRVRRPGDGRCCARSWCPPPTRRATSGAGCCATPQLRGPGAHPVAGAGGEHGGLMGTFARGELPTELEAAAFALPAGATSEIVATTARPPRAAGGRAPARAARPPSTSAARASGAARSRGESGPCRPRVRPGLMARAKVNHEAVKAPPAVR